MDGTALPSFLQKVVHMHGTQKVTKPELSYDLVMHACIANL